jgi:hypothetical protein
MKLCHLTANAVDEIRGLDTNAPNWPDAAEWVLAPDSVYMGCIWNGTLVTEPDGTPLPPDPLPAGRYVLTGAEWVERFTDDEWDWIDVQKTTEPRTAAIKQLRRLLAAIEGTDSINVEPGASGYVDGFYTWLLNNGIPGGQARIDELRAPK